MDNIQEEKKPDNTILFILLDAFRWDYVTKEDSPTIWELTQNGIYTKKLVSSSGFTQRSAIFTGAQSDVHGNYTMYTYDPKTSPFKILKTLSPLLRIIDSSWGKMYSFVRKIINQIPKLTTDWAPPASIPSEILHLISVTEDLNPIYKPGNLPIESIFDVFKKYNISYSYMMAPVSGHDEPTMQQMLNAINPETQAYFVQFSDTDGLVHRDGTGSRTRKETVKKVDERVAILKKKMESIHKDPWIIVIGDHGMVDVETYIDIYTPVIEHAKNNKIIHGKDFLMFLDSTLARFWFFTNKGIAMRSYIEKLLSNKPGEFLHEEYMKERNIPIGDRRFGDLIWKADVKIGIFPDYFHSEKDRYKAMHGYDSHEDSMKGMAVIFHNTAKPKKIDQGNLEDLASTICAILNIPFPEKNKGVPLI